jgi:hypothetical protein
VDQQDVDKTLQWGRADRTPRAGPRTGRAPDIERSDSEAEGMRVAAEAQIQSVRFADADRRGRWGDARPVPPGRKIPDPPSPSTTDRHVRFIIRDAECLSRAPFSEDIPAREQSTKSFGSPLERAPEVPR